MPQISVIVPVYNVEQYLKRCVDSILEQTFTDFELILVDDGSPDNCGAICDEYAQKDSRIHVIHQKNGGLSAARNAGIDWVFANSDSQWLTFVDSDDWIHPQMMEILLDMVQSSGKKISVCGYQETAEMAFLEEVPKPVSALWAPEDFFVECNTNAVIACGKLYHRSCFDMIRYPLGKIHEDEFTTYLLLFEQQQITVTDASLYYYFQNTAGITKSRWSPKRLDAWQAYDEQISFFKKLDNKRLAKFCYRKYLWNAGGQLIQARKSEDFRQNKPYIRIIKRKLHALLWQIWRLGYTDILTDYAKCRMSDILDLPFIWKSELLKRWEK